MDVFDQELLNFWRYLNSHEVKYIMIGGFAVNLHGFSRMTADIDIWIKDEIGNRKKLGKSLEQFGYAGLSFKEINFVAGWSDFYIGKGIRLDIMTTILGLENILFDEAFANANIANIADVKVPFLDINRLIKNKKATNRPKDIIDVVELEKIIALNNQQ